LTAAAKIQSIAVPVIAMMVAMVCFQLGAVVAKGMFPVVGAVGTASLRLAIGSVLLFAVWRPWRTRFKPGEARNVLVYGLAMGWMNFFFYLSLRYLPLGVAVAVEFTGPLAVAILASRRVGDFLWILLAVFGLLALLPFGLGSTPLPPAGIACGLGAGACWALYIVYGRKAGATHGGQTVAFGTLIGALIIAPIGIAQNGLHLFSPVILPAAFAVAVLSSALPYSLEMFALPRVPPRTFGVLMSLDPALGALAGLFLLGERLTFIQWLAIASIMTACAGSAFTSASRAD
jgi:inner membrane transporter RhtA